MTFNRDTVIDHVTSCVVLVSVIMFANLVLASMYTTVWVDMNVVTMHSNVCFINAAFIIPIMGLVMINYFRELVGSVIDYFKQQPNQMRYYVGGYIGMIVYMIVGSVMIYNTYQYTILLITPVTMPAELAYMYSICYIIVYQMMRLAVIVSIYYSVISTITIFNTELVEDQAVIDDVKDDVKDE